MQRQSSLHVNRGHNGPSRYQQCYETLVAGRRLANQFKHSRVCLIWLFSQRLPSFSITHGLIYCVCHVSFAPWLKISWQFPQNRVGYQWKTHTHTLSLSGSPSSFFPFSVLVNKIVLLKVWDILFLPCMSSSNKDNLNLYTTLVYIYLTFLLFIYPQLLCPPTHHLWQATRKFRKFLGHVFSNFDHLLLPTIFRSDGK